MGEASLDDVGESGVFLRLSNFSFSKFEGTEASEVFEPLAEVTLVGEVERIGDFLDVHIGVLDQIPCIDQ